MMKYTDYCTCFVFRDRKGYAVQFYDEIKDRPLKTVRTADREEAYNLANKYVAQAPKNVICQKLEETV